LLKADEETAAASLNLFISASDSGNVSEWVSEWPIEWLALIARKDSGIENTLLIAEGEGDPERPGSAFS